MSAHPARAALRNSPRSPWPTGVSNHALVGAVPVELREIGCWGGGGGWRVWRVAMVASIDKALHPQFRQPQRSHASPLRTLACSLRCTRRVLALRPFERQGSGRGRFGTPLRRPLSVDQRAAPPARRQSWVREGEGAEVRTFCEHPRQRAGRQRRPGRVATLEDHSSAARCASGSWEMAGSNRRVVGCAGRPAPAHAGD